MANERAPPVTTACDCAGIIAPILGGGHGWLQGQHGLLADNILSARVVLADGTAVTASPSLNSDLFWALRGAGHNFGVVTSVEYRIFDVEPGQARVWAYEEYVFKQDKLEALFGWANELLRDDTGSPRPVELSHYGRFQFSPDIDAENVSTLTLVRLGWKWGHEQLILTYLKLEASYCILAYMAGSWHCSASVYGSRPRPASRKHQGQHRGYHRHECRGRRSVRDTSVCQGVDQRDAVRRVSEKMEHCRPASDIKHLWYPAARAAQLVRPPRGIFDEGGRGCLR